MENWFKMFQETFCSEFSLWIDSVNDYIIELSEYSYNLNDITKKIHPDLWDEEMERSKYILYDKDWEGNRCNLIVHQAYSMWKSKLDPKEAARFLIMDFQEKD